MRSAHYGRVKNAAKEWVCLYGKVAVFGLLIGVVVCSGVLVTKYTHSSSLSVVFLDVGQGDAIYIRTPSGKEMLVDGGPGDTVLSQLSRQMSFFDRDIDVIISTHPDADHITGLVSVLRVYDVRNVVVSPKSGDTGVFKVFNEEVIKEQTNVVTGEKGMVLDFGDGVQAKILYPNHTEQSPDGDTNDYSVSMVVTYGEHSFLLTGDLPDYLESRLVQSGLQSNVTVYKAGHHGSRTSSGELLLSYIKPEYVVISAGKDNSYGHPHKDTLERLGEYAQEIISTIDRGAITFETDGNEIQVHTQK